MTSCTRITTKSQNQAAKAQNIASYKSYLKQKIQDSKLKYKKHLTLKNVLSSFIDNNNKQNFLFTNT